MVLLGSIWVSLGAFSDSFIYSTRIYWVHTHGPGTALGIGGTVVNKMKQADEVSAHLEPVHLSPIMHSHLITKPSQGYNFSACLVSLFLLSPNLSYLVR